MADFENLNNDTLITGTAGADNIYNSGENVTIIAGAGNDSIYHYGYSYSYSYVTVDGGAGNDTIVGRFGDSSVYGGAGNDVIDLSEGDVDRATVNGGAGDDTIYNDGYDGINVFQYGSGDGKDVIYGLTNNDTLQIKSGSISRASLSGNDVILKVGSGSVTLKDGAGVELAIMDANGNVEYTIPGAIINTVDSTLVAGTSNADLIYNSFYDATIDGGAGDDTITNDGYYSSVNGGAGNDLIDIYGYSTVTGGAGNDTINNNNRRDSVIQYASGDGNDLITGFNEVDTLQITSGSINKAQVSGNNVILTVGSGKITLDDYNGRNIQLVNSSGTLTTTMVGSARILNGTNGADNLTNSLAGYTISGGKGNDTITNSADFVSISGGAGNDSVIVSNNYVTINGGAGNDTIQNNNYAYNVFQYAKGDGNDVILGYGYDTIQITSGNVDSVYASGLDVFVKVGSNTITLKEATGKDIYIRDSDGILTSHLFDGTITGTAGADTITNNNDYTYINALGGNDSIYGSSYVYDLTIDGGAGADTISGYYGYSSINGGAGNDNISLDGGYYTTVMGGTGNDAVYFIDNGSYYRTYQYTNGDGNDTVYGFNSYDTLAIDGDSYQTVISGDDLKVNVGKGSILLKDAAGLDVNIIAMTSILKGTSKADTLTNEADGIKIDALGGNDYIYNTGRNVSISAGAGNDTVESYVGDYYNEENTIDGGAGNDLIICSSYSTSGAVINGGAGNDTLENNVERATVDGGAGNDYLYNSGYDASISGGDGKDTIENFESYATLDGGAGNDYIYTTESSTITGGKGNDTIDLDLDAAALIQYDNGDGNDYIVNFGAGDTLKVTSGSVKSVTAKGMDVIFQIGSGKITMEGAASKELTYIDASGNAHSTMVSGVWEGTGKNDYIRNDERENIRINALGGNDSVFSYMSNVTIDGGAGRDYLINGYYIHYYDNGEAYGVDSENVSVFGGAGNDRIENWSANVTIDGGAGHDYIELCGEYVRNSSYYQSSQNVTVRGGKGNDTIDNSGGGSGNVYQYAAGDGRDVIVGFSASDTIQITSGSVSDTLTSGYSTVLKIGSGSITLYNYTGDVNISDSAVRGSNAMWFTEDDTNFLTSDAQLSDITQSEYSVTSIETASSFDTFAQDTILAAANSR